MASLEKSTHQAKKEMNRELYGFEEQTGFVGFVLFCF
jgi:hypothetical protein